MMNPNIPISIRTIHATLLAAGAIATLLALPHRAVTAATQDVGESATLFREKVAPVLERHCVHCHGPVSQKGGLELHTFDKFTAGADGDAIVTPVQPDASTLLRVISGPDPDMPKKADPLKPEQIEAIRAWIASGAVWPEGMTLEDRHVGDTDWWSFQPLRRPPVPTVSDTDRRKIRTPVDAFIFATLREKGLTPAPRADRRTLIRRLYFDLHGLPPEPARVEAFVRDNDPRAYEKLVDELLNSPHYGERWARHWLDLVHYADTHGYDKDKPRPNAWPYRDYVIRAFNDDKPWSRFVKEQVAGDVLWPNSTDGVVATGMLAAGPWDFIGHAEVPESKIDGKVARNIDRDDMVRTVVQSFNSVTVGCARCHNHKFDPIEMDDYYQLQAVFAALDRADRDYEPIPEIAEQRVDLTSQHERLSARLDEIVGQIHARAGDTLKELDGRIASLSNAAEAGADPRPEYGYHSRIERSADVAKWVQVDLGEPTALDAIVIVASHDKFNEIGAGFGFPVRFTIEVSNNENFAADVHVIANHAGADYPNPGVEPQRFDAKGHVARYIRVTATKLANRLKNDYIFALAELEAIIPGGANVAAGATVTSLDSIEAPTRWRRTNLVDGYFYGVWNRVSNTELAQLREQRQKMLAKAMTPELRDERQRVLDELERVNELLQKLPPKARVYTSHVHDGDGNFRGRAGLGPRAIHVLHRGDVTSPGKRVEPGVPPFVPGVDTTFDLPADHAEGDRRVALAEWLTRHDHPLTWRSIVNRVWQHHFGRGLVDTPNDFGRMGQQPTHPQLLDWLAVEFRDNGQSLKKLHRLMVLSSAYRRASQGDATNETIDADNRFLWRFNRRRLDAESIRDAVLDIAGKLDPKMGGPGYRDFVIDKPQHSPHYLYHQHDPDDPATHRRSIYRFIVRSQTQPLMTTLDCADPAQMVAKRDETLTALQALAMLNNPLMLRMYEHMAARLTREADTVEARIDLAFRLAMARPASHDEIVALSAYAQEHGMANTCRVIMNLNEFVFVD